VRRKVKNFKKKLFLEINNHRPSNLFGLVSTKSPNRHPTISKMRLKDIEVVSIEPLLKVEIFKNKKDEGYHNYSNAWWYNLNCPYSYNYLNLDSLYPKQYFENDKSAHPNFKVSEDLYEYMQIIYHEVSGNKFQSILELGTGGGYITQQFYKHDLDFFAVEGSEEGIKKLLSIGIKENLIMKSDLRKMKSLQKSFDLVMCTEVIEHIEPFFASKLVELCTTHSNYVWFSCADRKRKPHWHHINEISIEAWDNLFAFFGFNSFVELDGRHSRADRLYMRIAPQTPDSSNEI
jgi:hypothetical protein